MDPLGYVENRALSEVLKAQAPTKAPPFELQGHTVHPNPKPKTQNPKPYILTPVPLAPSHPTETLLAAMPPSTSNNQKLSPTFPFQTT